jgi:diguanylate cyclase
MLDYGGASVGVVAIDPRTTSAEEALRMADDAMYAVKRSRQAAASRAAMATGTAGAKEASPAA